MPSDVGDILTAIGAFFALVVLLGAALGVLRSKQWQAEREVLRGSIETLQQAREIDKDAAVEADRRHTAEVAELRGQISVMQSEFFATLTEKVTATVVDAIHPLLSEIQRPPTRRRTATPPKGSR